MCHMYDIELEMRQLSKDKDNELALNYFLQYPSMTCLEKVIQGFLNEQHKVGTLNNVLKLRQNTAGKKLRVVLRYRTTYVRIRFLQIYMYGSYM